jgi:hypothetical protein
MLFYQPINYGIAYKEDHFYCCFKNPKLNLAACMESSQQRNRVLHNCFESPWVAKVKGWRALSFFRDFVYQFCIRVYDGLCHSTHMFVEYIGKRIGHVHINP